MINTSHKNEQTPNLLKPADVAITLNISKSLAYQLIRSGQLLSIRFRRSIRVRPVDLEVFISECLTQINPTHNQD
jgi:excisionase family DNA binding protein